MSFDTRSLLQNKILKDRFDKVDTALTDARAANLKKRKTALAATNAAAGWVGFGGDRAYSARLTQRRADLTREIARAEAPVFDQALKSLLSATNPVPAGSARVFGVISGGTPSDLKVALRKSDGTILASTSPDQLGVYQIDTACTGKEIVVELLNASDQLILQDGVPVSLQSGSTIMRNFTITLRGDVSVDGGGNQQNNHDAMPDLIGQTIKEGKSRLAAMGIADVGISDQFDDTPKGVIIQQDPDAGQQVVPGTKVRLVVSLGPKPKTVMPDLIGKSVVGARADLAGFSYRELAFDYVFDPNHADQVVKQDPQPGAPFGQDTRILLRVGQAPKPMPNVVGATEDQARAILVPRFADDVAISYLSAEAKEKHVFKQYPDEGTPLTPSIRISLSVCKKTKKIAGCKMPNLVGQTEDEAYKILKKQGDIHIESRYGAADAPKSEVTGHRPGAGEKIGPGDRVYLFVSSGPEKSRPLPNLVGLSKSQVKAAVVSKFSDKVKLKPVQSDAKPGTVIGQSPKPGLRLTPQQAVTLKIAKPKIVAGAPLIPDVTGLTVAEAKKALAQSGIKKVDYDQQAARRKNWRVKAQDPSAGVAAKSDLTVVLTLGLKV